MKNERENRLGEETLNKQGCLMKVVKYNSTRDIIVEFQDEYKTEVHTSYREFVNGNVKNPYYPSVCGVGMVGVKYKAAIGRNAIKEYEAWRGMIRRCFDKKTKEKGFAYKDVTCCKEWLNYENFYEWLHSQENFDKWYNDDGFDVDKDILVKGNKIYSPDTCCLVPQNVNKLFIKNNESRGNLPIGVTKYFNKFKAYCVNPFTGLWEYLGLHSSIIKAFEAYKIKKESYIKKMAQTEFSLGNITKRCYDAMMNYEVEITD